MSDHMLLAGLAQSVQALFADAITSDPAPGLHGVPVDLRSPREARPDGSALSLWLYRVDAVAASRAMLPTRAPSGDGPDRGLPLDAHFLITPLAPPEQAHLLLGKALETLRGHPLLAGADLRGALAGGGYQLRLTLETLTLGESAQLWLALQEPQRLAVACVARLVEAAS
jgi:hypothetical protein